MNSEECFNYRRAIEVLRSGVPNRDAVRELGCNQTEIENKFRENLQYVKQGAPDDSKTYGILAEGGFGTGKSHLLLYLMDIALHENFVCSKIVISKETPLHDPVKLYRNAVEVAIIPDRIGSALTEIATKIDFNSPAYVDFYKWINNPNSKINSRFAATLFLFERLKQQDQVLIDSIIQFWSGENLGVNEVRKYLRGCGQSVAYNIEKIPIRKLALQRFIFTSQLIKAAGYAGWILFIDEVERIANYSLMQRAKSYVELARWMGELEESNFPRIATVLTITDDFIKSVFEERDDIDKVPNRIRAKGENDFLFASQAERGMHVIQNGRMSLEKTSDEMIKQTYDKVRTIHAKAYNWDPPDVETGIDKLSSTRIRQYIKGWITEWDLKRLYPEYKPDIERGELKIDYTENVDIEKPTEESENNTFTNEEI